MIYHIGFVLFVVSLFHSFLFVPFVSFDDYLSHRISRILLDVKLRTILAHTLDDDVAYLLTYNLGIGMCFAGHVVIAKVKNVTPFGKRIGICHYGIGINRQDASCILRLQAGLQKPIISPFAHPAYKAIHHALPSGAATIPMRTRYLHATLLLQVAIACALLGYAVW